MFLFCHKPRVVESRRESGEFEKNFTVAICAAVAMGDNNGGWCSDAAASSDVNFYRPRCHNFSSCGGMAFTLLFFPASPFIVIKKLKVGMRTTRREMWPSLYTMPGRKGARKEGKFSKHCTIFHCFANSPTRRYRLWGQVVKLLLFFSPRSCKFILSNGMRA